MVDNTKQLFEIVRVIDVIDIQGGDRIKLRTSNDINLTDDKIPFAFPLLPKHIYIKPKKDEYVIVLAIDNEHRFFIGPIIPQLDKLLKESTLYAKSFFPEGIVAPNKNPKYVRGSDGVYPQEEDIAILGRENADVILKNNEVWVRAGSYRETADGKVFSENPAYLMVKNDPNGQYRNGEETVNYKTVTTLVADEINLISSSKEAKQLFKVSNPTEMIDSIEMKKILEKAYRLPYGDILVEILLTMLNFTITHVHNGNLAPPSFSSESVKLIEEVREKIKSKLLSNNVRIN